MFITASIGIISADCAACGVTCFLGLYHALMVLMLLLQIAVVCFYFFDKSWESDLPADSTGVCPSTHHPIVTSRPNAQNKGIGRSLVRNCCHLSVRLHRPSQGSSSTLSSACHTCRRVSKVEGHNLEAYPSLQDCWACSTRPAAAVPHGVVQPVLRRGPATITGSPGPPITGQPPPVSSG